MNQQTFLGPEKDPEGEARLVRNAQFYLQQRQQQGVPDALLSESWDHFFMVINGEVLLGFADSHQLTSECTDDLAQDFWVQAIRHLPDFVGNESVPGFRAWAHTVVHHKAIDLFRRNARHPTENLDRVLDQGQEPADRSEDPAVHLERRENIEMIRAFVDELRSDLPKSEFRLLKLRWLEERPLAEVAGLLKLTPKQVAEKQCRLFKKLRKRYVIFEKKQK